MEEHGGNIYRLERDFNIRRDKIIDFSSNINPLGVPKDLRKVISENTDKISSYPDPEYVDLRNSIAVYNSVKPGTIAVGNGAVELIYNISTIVNPKNGLIIAPTFSEYGISLKKAGTDITYFHLKDEDDFSPEIQELCREISRGYDIIFICNPNNPTANFISREKVKQIIDEACRHKTWIVIDESFIEFMGPVEDLSAAAFCKEYNRLIILRSMTKFFAIPGLRLGYAINFNPDMINRISSERIPWSVNFLADISARTVLNNIDYIKRTREYVKNESRYLSENLERLGWLRPFRSKINFFLVRILNNTDSTSLKKILAEKGILIRDASNYESLDNRYVRISVRDRKSNEILLKNLNMI